MADGENEDDTDAFDPIPEEEQQESQEQQETASDAEPQEAEPELEPEVATVTAAAPAVNGHRVAQAAPQVATVRRTDVIHHPEQPYTPPKPRQQYRPAPMRREPVKNQTHREIIENIIAIPESVDWEFAVYRTAGTIAPTASGEPARRGFLDCYDTIPVDTLMDAILHDWGGGEYKIITRNKAGKAAIVSHPQVRAAYLSLSTEQSPPKNAKNAAESLAITETRTPDDDELSDIRRERERELERERTDRARARRMESELALKRKQKELRELDKDDNGQTSALEKLLEGVIRKQEEDRKDANARFEKLGEMILRIAERPAAPPPPDKTSEIMATMQASQNTLLGQLLPALVTQKPEKKDDTFELMKYSQEQTRLMMETFTKQGMKGESVEREMMRSMMNQMIQVITNPKTGGQAMSVKDTLDLLKSTRKETMDMIAQIRGGDEGGGGGDDGWDPKKGIAGNLFSMLKDVIGAAVNTPGGQQLLMKFFNKANPTDQDAMALAQRMEAEEAQRMMMLPGPQAQQQMQVMPQQQRQAVIRPQSPLITPQAPRAQAADAIPGVAIPQRQVAPPPQVAPPAQPVVTPQPVKPEPTVTVEQQQADVQAVLEGEATGVDDLSGMQPIPEAQPAPNAAPQTEAIIAAPTPAGSPVEAAADLQQAPPMQEPAPSNAPEPVHPSQMIPDESELRLIDRVTETMAMAIGNVQDEIATHDWPEYAADKWNGKFLRLLIEEQDDVKRAHLIGSRCHSEVWAKLNEVLSKSTAEPPQWNAFYNGVRAVVAMAKGE